MVTCRIYEEWRVRMEPGQSAPPRDVEAHLAACATCRRSRTRYEGAIDAIRDQVERTSSTGPDMVAIRAGLAADHAADRLPARSRAGGRGLAVAAAAMAAVVLAALGGWFVLDREHPVFATHSPAATPSGDPSTPLVTDVRPGQWIQTEGAETRVSDSRVADLKVGPYTHLQVGAWDTIRTVLFLDEGRIDVSVRSLKADETFEIRTPLALVRVVGTRFRTLHRTGVETVVTCVEGEVKVETLAEVELARVRAGYEVRVTRDGVEGPRPVALDLDAVDRLARAPAPTPAMAPAPVVDRTPWGSPGAAPLLASSQVTPRPAPRADVAPAGPAGTAAEPGTVIEEARRNLDRGQAQEAIEAIRRALESGTAPEPRLLALLGDALRVAGRPEEARAAYERSATSDSAAVPEGVLVDLAQVLQQDLGRPREAERTWWQYLTLHPRDATPRRRWAAWRCWPATRDVPASAERSGRGCWPSIRTRPRPRGPSPTRAGRCWPAGPPRTLGPGSPPGATTRCPPWRKPLSRGWCRPGPCRDAPTMPGPSRTST